MAERFGEGVYATVGLHPIHLVETAVDEEEDHFTTRAEVFDPEVYRALADSKKVVAIGECGLDYYRLGPAKRGGTTLNVVQIIELQKETLKAQIALAKGLGLALMLHCRQDARAGGRGETSPDAYDDQYEILKAAIYGSPSTGSGDIVLAERSRSPSIGSRDNLRAVMHSFCGTPEQAKKFIELGIFISISGIVTFKNADIVRDVVRTVPLEFLAMDTDSPYLAPEPKRGTRNVPANIEFIAAKIAEIKGESVARVAEQTTANALRLFGNAA